MNCTKLILTVIGALVSMPRIQSMDVPLQPTWIQITNGAATVAGQPLIAPRIDGNLLVSPDHIEITVRQYTGTSSFNLTRNGDRATLQKGSSAMINGKRYQAENNPKTIIMENGKIQVEENQ